MTLLSILFVNHIQKDFELPNISVRMMHQLQESCGITLALKAQGVTAEKVQHKPQERPVCENT